MSAWASAASGGFSTLVSIGWVFDRTDELVDRLQHAPGEEAQQELAPTPTGPAPSRWTLRGVRATFPWLKDYTLSGVWRLLHRHGLHIGAARVRQHSPDPDYLAKLEHLLSCLRDTAAHPDEVVLVFLDEMGYYRWPKEGRTWSQSARVPAPLADREGPNNKQWRLIGALNALSGRVDYLDAYISTKEFWNSEDLNFGVISPERRRLIETCCAVAHKRPDRTTLGTIGPLSPVAVAAGCAVRVPCG